MENNSNFKINVVEIQDEFFRNLLCFKSLGYYLDLNIFIKDLTTVNYFKSET